MSEIDNDIFNRLVLINQYTILSHLDTDQSEYWERSADKVRNYLPIDELPSADWLMEARRNPFTEDDRTFVYDVLSMYEALQHAENQAVALKNGNGAAFEGFDGNNESKYRSYVKSLVEHEGKYTYLRFVKNDFNAHHPTLELYRRMIEEWAKCDRPFELTKTQYDAIVDARVHPMNRK